MTSVSPQILAYFQTCQSQPCKCYWLSCFVRESITWETLKISFTLETYRQSDADFVWLVTSECDCFAFSQLCCLHLHWKQGKAPVLLYMDKPGPDLAISYVFSLNQCYSPHQFSHSSKMTFRFTKLFPSILSLPSHIHSTLAFTQPNFTHLPSGNLNITFFKFHSKLSSHII